MKTVATLSAALLFIVLGTACPAQAPWSDLSGTRQRPNVSLSGDFGAADAFGYVFINEDSVSGTQLVRVNEAGRVVATRTLDTPDANRFGVLRSFRGRVYFIGESSGPFVESGPGFQEYLLSRRLEVEVLGEDLVPVQAMSVTPPILRQSTISQRMSGGPGSVLSDFVGEFGPDGKFYRSATSIRYEGTATSAGSFSNFKPTWMIYDLAAGTVEEYDTYDDIGWDWAYASDLHVTADKAYVSAASVRNGRVSLDETIVTDLRGELINSVRTKTTKLASPAHHYTQSGDHLIGVRSFNYTIPVTATRFDSVRNRIDTSTYDSLVEANVVERRTLNFALQDTLLLPLGSYLEVASSIVADGAGGAYALVQVTQPTTDPLLSAPPTAYLTRFREDLTTAWRERLGSGLYMASPILAADGGAIVYWRSFDRQAREWSLQIRRYSPEGQVVSSREVVLGPRPRYFLGPNPTPGTLRFDESLLVEHPSATLTLYTSLGQRAFAKTMDGPTVELGGVLPKGAYVYTLTDRAEGLLDRGALIMN